MGLDKTDNPSDPEGLDDTSNITDNEMVPDNSERLDAAAPTVTVHAEAEIDTEWNQFMEPDSITSTEQPALPSREEFLDDDTALPFTEHVDELAELKESAEWKSMRQFSNWREMSKDINSVLEDKKVKLKKGKRLGEVSRTRALLRKDRRIVRRSR